MYSEKVLRWKEGRQNADVEEREGIRDEVACEQRDVGGCTVWARQRRSLRCQWLPLLREINEATPAEKKRSAQLS